MHFDLSVRIAWVAGFYMQCFYGRAKGGECKLLIAPKRGDVDEGEYAAEQEDDDSALGVFQDVPEERHCVECPRDAVLVVDLGDGVELTGMAAINACDVALDQHLGSRSFV